MSALSLLAAALLAADAPPLVAVLYFDVDPASAMAEDMLVLRKGLAEMLITDLVASGQVRVVERARLEDVLAEQKLQASGKIDPATAVKVGKLLGAKYLLVGSLFVLPRTTTVMLQYRVIREELGEAQATGRESGPLESIFELEQRIARAAQQQLAALEKKPQGAAAPARGKVKLASVMKFSKAQALKDSKDTAGAKKLLKEVVAEEPDLKVAQLDLLSLGD